MDLVAEETSEKAPLADTWLGQNRTRSFRGRGVRMGGRCIVSDRLHGPELDPEVVLHETAAERWGRYRWVLRSSDRSRLTESPDPFDRDRRVYAQIDRVWNAS